MYPNQNGCNWKAVQVDKRPAVCWTSKQCVPPQEESFLVSLNRILVCRPICWWFLLVKKCPSGLVPIVHLLSCFLAQMPHSTTRQIPGPVYSQTSCPTHAYILWQRVHPSARPAKIFQSEGDTTNPVDSVQPPTAMWFFCKTSGTTFFI